MLRTLLCNLQMWLSIGSSGGLLHSVFKELKSRFHLNTINKPTPAFMMFHEEFLFTQLVKKLIISFEFSKFMTHFTSTSYLILLWTTGIHLTLVCPALLKFYYYPSISALLCCSGLPTKILYTYFIPSCISHVCLVFFDFLP